MNPGDGLRSARPRGHVEAGRAWRAQTTRHRALVGEPCPRCGALAVELDQGHDEGPAPPAHCYVVRARVRSGKRAALLPVAPEFAAMAAADDALAKLLADAVVEVL